MTATWHPLTLLALAVGAVAALWATVTAERRAGALRRRAWAISGLTRPVGAERRERVRGWATGLAGRLPRGGVAGAATATVAAVGVAVLVGGVRGIGMGLAVGGGVLAWRRQRRRAGVEAGADKATAAQVRRQLPLAADLLAACLAAGAGPRQAAEAVGGCLGGPLGDQLGRVAAELRLGGDPARCWARFAAAVPDAAGLAHRMERTCDSGAPSARPMTALASQCRTDATRTLQAGARRAGVLATAPLGLCFLPAFLLVGVVPLVVGLTESMLTGP